MINITDKKSCCGCNACYNSCRQKCISMQPDGEGFWYPVVNTKECTNCGLCEKVCPILSKNMVHNDFAAYACLNKDTAIRQQSSSGGVFTLIAESVIGNHGIVFGAGFDGDFNVIHRWTNSLDGLGAFRGSKYVQSYIGDTYKQVKDFLQQGRQVLFSGTPCQVAGLRSYLDKADERLICLDVICHGVPSPLVWAKYRRKITDKRELRTVSFRDKTLGWKKFSLRLTYHNDEYIKDLGSDEFMQGFLKNVYLRPSCYHCKFKTLQHQSDITMADFWGIENVLPDFDDDQGTSLILVNSKKGNAIFLAAADKMRYKKVDIDQAIVYNSNAVKSVDYNLKRDKFFRELLGPADISQLIAKYTKISFSRKVHLKLKTILGRFF